MSREEQIFEPINMPLRGSLTMPGDKSIASRAVFLAAMAEGTSHIFDLPRSLDVMTVVAVARDLGAKVKILDSNHRNKVNFDLEVTGWGKKGPQPMKSSIYCGNSATCARVAMGVLAPFDVAMIVDGDESLHRRPFMRIVDPLMQMGANFKVVAQKNGKPQRSSLPMEIIGNSEANPIYYEMPVASSQVKTSILFAGANVSGETTVIEPYQSRNHDQILLKAFGANIKHNKDLLSVAINGPANLKACDIWIPGDVSSAAYYLTAAAMVPGSKITIENIGINPTRLGFINALKEMGSRIEIEEIPEEESLSKNLNYQGEPIGNITVQYAGRLKSITVSPDKIPSMIDEVPILAMAAATAEGTSTFYGVRELKLKESNRIHAISEGLRKLGTKASDTGDTLTIEGGIDIEAKRSMNEVKDDVVLLKHRYDHRLAICWALMGLCSYVPVKMHNFEVSHVGYPQFLDDFNDLVLESKKGK